MQKQVMATFRSHNLLHFLELSSKPLKFLTMEDESAGSKNADYLDSEQQNQLLVSWLVSSMTEGVLTCMVGSNTASQIWTKLNTYLATCKSKSITTEDYVVKCQ